MIIHSVGNGIEIKMAPHKFLIELKLRSTRQKDLWDVARLDELQNRTNKD